MNEKNRRKNERVPFQTSASINFAGKVFENLHVKNLSMRGVLLFGDVGLKESDQCKIKLFLAGSSSSLCLKMQGEVIRVSDEGVGLHFVELDPDTFFHLKNIIYYNSKDHDQAEESFTADLPEGSFA
jgi:hypothetical protein